jgi:hypothetical protein
MANELQEIQEKLEQVAREREAERIAAHDQAMKQLAEVRAKEEARQIAAKEAMQLAQERANKRSADKQRAEEECLREEANIRRQIEQEEDCKQASIDGILRIKEAIKKRMDDLEHAEDLAKRQLRDAILQASAPMEEAHVHPLERFLQKAPQ